MKKTIKMCLFIALLGVFAAASNYSQTPNLIKRTTYKTETIEFGVGGTLTVVGAPQGTVKIEGWNKNEVSISAEIQMQAASEADLALLSEVNGFAIDDSAGHISILTVGTHDKDYMKRKNKKFPKKLLGLPFTVNYEIKVPSYCDLDVNTGTGDLKIIGVEGSIIIKSQKGNGDLSFKGGSILATFGEGNLNINIENRSWRGRQADFKLAAGTISVKMPAAMNANIDAAILRSGKIENEFSTFKPRDRTKFSEKNILARAGSGGALLSFTVGDGLIKIQSQ